MQKLIIILVCLLQSFVQVSSSSFSTAFIFNQFLVPSQPSTTTHKMTENPSKKTKVFPPWPSTGHPQVLITGGAGYIGSHTILCLIEAGYDVTVVDNLVNSNEESLRRVTELTGCLPESNRIRFYNVDLCDANDLDDVFQTSPSFASCIHFAGLKAVGESVQLPLKYYHNNLDGTLNLLDCMEKHGCRSIIFSSSATV